MKNHLKLAIVLLVIGGALIKAADYLIEQERMEVEREL